MEKANASSTVNVTGGLFSTSKYSGVVIVFILGTGAVFSFLTVIGNLLVMLSVKVNKNLKTVGNYFLFSLACTDLFAGLFSINIYAIYISLDYWPGDTLSCEFWLTVDYAVGHASVLHLLLISFDRYFCITKPMTYLVYRNTTMAGFLIVAVWTLSFLIWTPLILFWDFFAKRVKTRPGSCYCQFIFDPLATFTTSFLFFYLPLCIMAYLYWRIVKTSYDSSRRTSRRPSCGSSSDNVSIPEEGICITTKQEEEENKEEGEVDAAAEEKEMLEPCRVVFKELQADQMDSSSKSVSALTSKESNILRKSSTVAYRNVSLQIMDNRKRRYSTSREIKVTRTIMAVMIAFIATWTPYYVVVLVHPICNECISDTLWGAAYWLCYFNSTINPACYALCNDTFKITFKQLLLCQYKNIRGQSLPA